jgi:hypothetical protein
LSARTGRAYVNEDMDELQYRRQRARLGALLERCVYGAFDLDHLRAQLWAVYGADTVELQGQAAAEIGECL